MNIDTITERKDMPPITITAKIQDSPRSTLSILLPTSLMAAVDTYIDLCHVLVMSSIDLRHLLSTSSHISAIKSCVNGCCESTGSVVGIALPCFANSFLSLYRQLSATPVIATPSVICSSAVSNRVVSLLMPTIYQAIVPLANIPVAAQTVKRARQ